MRSHRGALIMRYTIGVYAAGMVVVAFLVATMGDRHPFGMLLLFGPRWMLAAPWLVLLPLAWFLSRRMGGVALVGTAVTLFSVSGFEVPTLPMPPRALGAQAATLRLVTYNTDGSTELASRIGADVLRWNADMLLLQDCAPEVAQALRAYRSTRRPPRRYRLYVDPEFCLLSALPIQGLTRKPATDGAYDSGRAVRFEVIWQGEPVTMATVHLPSPRLALFAARQGDFTLLASSIRTRFGASQATAKWIREGSRSGPLIVAGDFNLPAESPALRDHWGGLRNAFSEAGWGFGHTMFAGSHRVRIDHILVDRAVDVRDVSVLSGYPSEHQPVVADLTIGR